MDMLKQQLCTFGLVTLILTLVSLIILYSPFSHTCGLYQGHPTSIFGNICSEDDLRSRIFGTFFVKFIACLPLLGRRKLLVAREKKPPVPRVSPRIFEHLKIAIIAHF